MLNATNGRTARAAPTLARPISRCCWRKYDRTETRRDQAGPAAAPGARQCVARRGACGSHHDRHGIDPEVPDVVRFLLCESATKPGAARGMGHLREFPG